MLAFAAPEICQHPAPEAATHAGYLEIPSRGESGRALREVEMFLKVGLSSSVSVDTFSQVKVPFLITIASSEMQIHNCILHIISVTFSKVHQ